MKATLKNENILSKWIPLKLITILIGIMALAGYICLQLDTLSIREQEKIFNQQQLMQTRLVATALDDSLQSILDTSSTIAKYSIIDVITNKRPISSLKKLFTIKQHDINSLAFLSFHQDPNNELITSSINSPKRIEAHKTANLWVDKYFSTISSIRNGFITPKPVINREFRLAGILIPVWADNKFSGIMTVVIDLDHLTERYISPLQIGKYGSGYIVDGSGTVIFDQEKEILGNNVFELHKEYQDLIKVDSRMMHEASGMGEYSFTVKRQEHEERKLVAWSSVIIGEMKLIIAISAPETDVTSTMTSVRAVRTAMLGFICFLFFAVIFLFYYHRSKQILLAQNMELKRKDQLFKAIAANAPGIIYKSDLEQPFIMHYISEKVQKVTGYRPNDFLPGGKYNYYDIVHPHDKLRLKSAITNSLAESKPFAIEYRIIKENGSERWVYEKGTKLPDEPSMVGFILDITDRKNEEKALKKAEHDYLTIVTSAPLGIFKASPNGKFISANPQMAAYYGYDSPRELIEKITDISTDCYVSSETRHRLLTILKEFGRTENFEAKHKRRDGSTFWAAETVTAIKDSYGEIVHIEGFIADISERKEHEETMRRLAMFDNLTGLPNRVLFDDRMKQALSHAKRNRMMVAILYADLDNFKQVNDELGHIAGDAVLKEVAGRFSDCLRTSDTVSRIGGDEFIFILQDIGSRTEIEVVALRIIDAMRSPFYIGEKVYRLGVSLGISVYPDDASEKDKLVRTADEAMYKAKAEGKNNFSY